MRRWSERRQAVLFAILLVVSIAGVYGLAQALQAPEVPRKGSLRASLVVEGDAWTVAYEDALTVNNPAVGLLLEAGDRQGFEVRWTEYTIPAGVLVTAINDTVNGEGNRWWQYWVNEAYGRRAADRQEIFEGDVVVWRFMASQEGS